AYPVRQFLIAPVDDDASPFSPFSVLLDKDRDLWIGTHPVDLLADHGEGIKVVAGIGEIDRHDIGKAILGTGQAPEAAGRQKLGAFESTERADSHIQCPM